MLPDGSFLSVLLSPDDARRAANRRHYRKTSARPRRAVAPRPVRAGTPVRVIAFALAVTASDGAARTESYRLLTTLLDPAAAPAAELAAVYARRWAVETAFAELKTYLRGAGAVLRSGDPAGIRQELWAFLVIYQAIRIVICAAAASAGLDPGRVSFTAALHAIRHHARRGDPATTLAAVEASILDPRCLVRHRPGRAYPRLTRRAAAGPSPAGTAMPAPLPRRQTCAITITPPTPALPTGPDQPRQQQKHPEASP